MGGDGLLCSLKMAMTVMMSEEGWELELEWILNDDVEVEEWMERKSTFSKKGGLAFSIISSSLLLDI
jgi:hypothetical protein